ncbi:bacteriohemerythrin [Ideonella livida]|uniref:Bacteriohemerythrin n=1 Tax=Ideonella livida TaxID=2707176 RepID=A0A7C9TI96_9BURK|nr:bacteriohemerythrin [Ideonella livida]NDY90222.1 bacteriohemerythrin [Ideonella livida]
MGITWTTDLNTGIEVIDNQHRRIVEYINQLEQAALRRDMPSVGRVLEDLVDYTQSHFAFEESLQEEVGYQYAKPHKAVHEMFIKRVSGYQQRHAAGENVIEALHTMLSTWLIHHIKRDDMAYVREVGVKAQAATQPTQTGGWLGRSLKRFFG